MADDRPLTPSEVRELLELTSAKLETSEQALKVIALFTEAVVDFIWRVLSDPVLRATLERYAEMGSGWISVADRMPQEHVEVAVLVEDLSVAIQHHPTVARLQIERLLNPQQIRWWAGLPGKWHLLGQDGWTVTHWMPLPSPETSK